MTISPKLRHKITRHWQCRSGHIVSAEYKPDVCRECKKTLTDLWLSQFTEVITPNASTINQPQQS